MRMQAQQRWIVLKLEIDNPETLSTRHRQCWHWPELESSQETSEPTQYGGELQTTSEHGPNELHKWHIQKKYQEAPYPAGVNSVSWDHFLHSSLYTVVGVNSHSQSAWGSAMDRPKQSRLNYDRKAHITHTGDISGAPSSGNQVDWAPQHTYFGGRIDELSEYFNKNINSKNKKGLRNHKKEPVGNEQHIRRNQQKIRGRGLN